MIYKTLKKAINLVLILLVIVSCVSCGKKDNKEETPKEEMPRIVNVFIKKVDAIKEVTLSSKDDLDLCIMLYTCIEDTYLDLLEKPEIVNAKSSLDTKISKYNELKAKDYDDNKKQSLIKNFVDSVNNLPSIDMISLEDLSVILTAEKNYELLPEELKQNNDVIEANKKLVEIRTEYDIVTSFDPEAYNAHKFVVGVSKLPNKSDLTIQDITVFDELETLYNSLSSENKQLEKVVDAKATFDSYNDKVTELKNAKQNATDFIMKVFSLPNGSGLKWQNEAQRKEIDSAFTLYEKLTDFEKTIDGVDEAYKELNTIKNLFDSLKEPYDISKITPTNLCFYLPQVRELTFVNGADPYTVLKNNYGLTDETIKQNVKIFLDVYIEGGAIKGSPLFSFDITENYKITTDMVIAKLKELRDAGNEQITTKGYTFTIHIESLNDTYGNSEYSDFFSAMNITL